jgi:hypothetical protein
MASSNPGKRLEKVVIFAEKKGLWQTIPERRKEFLQVAQLGEKSANALAIALQVNRSQMNQGRLGSTFGCHRGRTEAH